MKEQVKDIVIETKDFMNKKYIDIRKYYVPEPGQEPKPTSKGIMVNAESFYKILDILNSHKKEIDEYFGGKQ
jgi:hypothetical protein